MTYILLSTAITLFVVTAIGSWLFYRLIPSWLANAIEPFLIVLGFIGVLVAVSQVMSDSSKTQSLRLVGEAESLFGRMLYSAEHRMEDCNVWWNVALDQTNKNPPKCNVSQKCKDACYVGHMITQSRWDPVASSLGQWRTYQRNLCRVESREHYGSTIEVKVRDPICDSLDGFVLALANAQAASSKADEGFPLNPMILTIIQLLIAVGLGLEIGKLRNKNEIQLSQSLSSANEEPPE